MTAYLSPEDFTTTETIAGVCGIIASTDENFIKTNSLDKKQNVQAAFQWYEILLPKPFTFINYGTLLEKQDGYIQERLYNDKTISLISSKQLWKNNEPIYRDPDLYKKLNTPEELFSFLNAKTNNDNILTTSFLFYLGINGVLFNDIILVFNPQFSAILNQIKREDA